MLARPTTRPVAFRALRILAPTLACLAFSQSPPHPATPTGPAIDPSIERVYSGPAEPGGRYRIVVVAEESSLTLYFDRVIFAEQEGDPPTATHIREIAPSDVSGERSLIRQVEVREWKGPSDVVIVVNDSRHCSVHLNQESYQATCQ
jgi:hypothetical protein